MSDRSRIEWTDATWNPIVGCTPVSPGCAHCYAARMGKRLAGRNGYPDDFSTVTFRERVLTQPLRWKRPRRIFVCSMGDIFHPDVRPEWISTAFYVMRDNPQHTFQVLTKRPENIPPGLVFPPNVWLGVTAENRDHIGRLDEISGTGAKVRFASFEPLLGPLGDLSPWIGPIINWVIVGGETGTGARPIHPDWVRSIRDQCQAAGVPFFFKQWGEWAHVEPTGAPDDGGDVLRVGKRRAGRLLDGREWNEFPEVRT